MVPRCFLTQWDCASEEATPHGAPRLSLFIWASGLQLRRPQAPQSALAACLLWARALYSCPSLPGARESAGLVQVAMPMLSESRAEPISNTERVMAYCAGATHDVPPPSHVIYILAEAGSDEDGRARMAPRRQRKMEEARKNKKETRPSAKPIRRILERARMLERAMAGDVGCSKGAWPGRARPLDGPVVRVETPDELLRWARGPWRRKKTQPRGLEQGRSRPAHMLSYVPVPAFAPSPVAPCRPRRGLQTTDDN